MKDTNMASKPDISANRFKRLCYSLNELKKTKYKRLMQVFKNAKTHLKLQV